MLEAILIIALAVVLIALFGEAMLELVCAIIDALSEDEI